MHRGDRSGRLIDEFFAKEGVLIVSRALELALFMDAKLDVESSGVLPGFGR
jgi:hypothetical protein